MKNWFKKIFGKGNTQSNSPFKEVRHGDKVSLYDQKTVDYLESELPKPTQAKLLKLLDKSEQVVILKKETNKNKTVMTPITVNGETFEMEGHPVESIEKIRITDPQELQKVLKHFEIKDEARGHLMCIGEYTFDFLDKEENSTLVEYLGFGHIRIEKEFNDDAALRQPLEFLNWLNSIGISEPLDSWIEDENRKRESEKRISEWKAAAPETLVKRMEAANQDPFGQSAEDIFKELKAEIPNEKELVLSLFKLYGTGFHSWNGVPVYEMIPSNILMGINIEFLTHVFETAALDKEHKEGIARFLSSWDFAQKRKTDLEQVSEEVKGKLLAHLEEMGDEEKINRFRNI